jgi:hypothetical protein
VAYACLSSDSRKAKIERSQGWQGGSREERLPRKPETQSSNSSSERKKEKKKITSRSSWAKSYSSSLREQVKVNFIIHFEVRKAQDCLSQCCVSVM